MNIEIASASANASRPASDFALRASTDKLADKSLGDRFSMTSGVYQPVPCHFEGRPPRVHQMQGQSPEEHRSVHDDVREDFRGAITQQIARYRAPPP